MKNLDLNCFTHMKPFMSSYAVVLLSGAKEKRVEKPRRNQGASDIDIHFLLKDSSVLKVAYIRFPLSLIFFRHISSVNSFKKYLISEGVS